MYGWIRTVRSMTIVVLGVRYWVHYFEGSFARAQCMCVGYDERLEIGVALQLELHVGSKWNFGNRRVSALRSNLRNHSEQHDWKW